jgi:acetyltransferase
LPDYRFPERAASALSVLARRAEQLSEPPPEVPGAAAYRPDLAAEAIAKAVVGESGFLDPDTAAWAVSAYGLKVPSEALARTPAEAALVAERIGWPVALKIASPDIPHKSDVGGVALGLHTRSAVEAAYARVASAVQSARPRAEILGVTVQAMASVGQDVIVGAVRDEQFGPLVMFGSGGVDVEGLRDVAFGLTPLHRREVEQMIESTWAGRKLHGHRGQPPGDREAVIQAVMAIGRLMEDVPGLQEVEVNPLRVLGEGAVALDVRMRISER